jgi:hypothetical protein
VVVSTDVQESVDRSTPENWGEERPEVAAEAVLMSGEVEVGERMEEAVEVGVEVGGEIGWQGQNQRARD